MLIYLDDSWLLALVINWLKLFLTQVDVLITRYHFHYIFTFKESILKFIRSALSSIFQCHNLKVIKYFIRLQMNFSHFRDHKFKHSFQDTTNLLCTCGLEGKTNHSILHCPYYENKHHILLASIRSIKSSILDQNNNIVETLPYGLDSLSETQNTSILNATVEFLISSNSFEEQLL